MRIMPSIIGRGRQVGVLDAFAADMQRTRRSHLHRTSLVNPGNYYAGHHKEGVLVTVTRSGRTKLLDPRCDLGNNASTGFAWGFNGSGPAQLALAILIDYFPTKPGGKALFGHSLRPWSSGITPDCTHPHENHGWLHIAGGIKQSWGGITTIGYCRWRTNESSIRRALVCCGSNASQGISSDQCCVSWQT